MSTGEKKNVGATAAPPSSVAASGTCVCVRVCAPAPRCAPPSRVSQMQTKKKTKSETPNTDFFFLLVFPRSPRPHPLPPCVAPPSLVKRAHHGQGQGRALAQTGRRRARRGQAAQARCVKKVARARARPVGALPAARALVRAASGLGRGAHGPSGTDIGGARGRRGRRGAQPWRDRAPLARWTRLFLVFSRETTSARRLTPHSPLSYSSIPTVASKSSHESVRDVVPRLKGGRSTDEEGERSPWSHHFSPTPPSCFPPTGPAPVRRRVRHDRAGGLATGEANGEGEMGRQRFWHAPGFG